MVSHSDFEPLPDVQTQDFLPPLSAWVKFGGLFVIGTIATAVAISSIAQYRVTVKAPAVIRPTGELRIVQAATAGTVMQVRVTPNQTVRSGDVIAQIDDSQLQTKRSQLQNGLRQTQLQILQIKAQIRSIESRITAERDRGNRAVAASEAEWSQRQRDYQNQQVISQSEVAEAQASLQAAQAALDTAQVRLARYRPIAAQGALERDRLAEAELAAQQQAQEVAVAQAKLQRARTSLNPTDAAVSMAIERIAQERATGEATLASLSQEREALIQQQIQLQNQLEQDMRELNQVERDLLKTTVRATTDGAIAKLNLRNAGQTVQPGEEIAQIVPSETQLTIKAMVPAQEISKIKVGQTANFRISACPYPDYGTLSGIVRTVSPDAITPPAQATSERPAAAAPYYEVTLEPESLVLSQGDRQCQIQVGMEGRIDIISSQDTVLRSILRKARLT
ncbi:MAG: HlyD family efflux transporter periplasmic adaptor subunit, partial [Microcoleus sp. SIO2G3]|nr:HlyD family efflux transporter periplasmic adaptor subunit [Microcoleus sp. SIO2G3]